ncbi:DUF2383 domain-containing protein [Mangrovibacterium lignilyticum]|uniref:DUF2383 domain-containing protein n=1 Tax=Mangrovibacterium lignilyticum TaxID=2668052 RepID=UPI0013D532E4|nr:DUF2383 domain-containing protein [Mangrovibacterium lignilyticum]
MRKTNLKNDLQRILDTCKDSANVFISAADHVKSEDLKNTLLLIALQRKNFVELLIRESWKSGYVLAPISSLGHILQKSFRAFMQPFASLDDEKLIISCRESEEKLVELYDITLMNEDIPINLYQLIVEHQQLVRITINEHLFVPAHV